MNQLSPEFREWHDKVITDQRRKFGPMLDAKFLEVQTLRLAEGHKARERASASLKDRR